MTATTNYAMPNQFGAILNGFGAGFGAGAGGGNVDPAAYAAPSADAMSQWGATLPGNANYDASLGGAGAFNAGVAKPGFGAGLKGWLSNSQNLGTMFQGLSALTGAYLGFQQLKQAKEGLKLQTRAFEANLANSTQSYNTGLEDRIRGRTSNYEGKENDVNAYLAKNSLKTGG